MSKKDDSDQSERPIVITDEDEILLYVRDRRKPTQYSIDNTIMDQWLPVIGTTGYTIYSLLIRMANESSGESCYPGYTMIQNHLRIGRSTVSYYISLLEWCQLIYRDRPEVVIIQNGERKRRRQGNRSNTYYILDVVPVTKEGLAAILRKIKESSINEDYKAKFLKRLEEWTPLQFHWSKRGRKRIKTVVAQPSLFEGKKQKPQETPLPETPPDVPSPPLKGYRIKTKDILSGFGIVGSPAKELASTDSALVLAWVWQCQSEKMDPEKSPGYVVKRLRQNDSPGEDRVAMAHAWLTMPADDRERLKEKMDSHRYGGWRDRKFSESLPDYFMPELMAESFDFYQKAVEVGALYADV